MVGEIATGISALKTAFDIAKNISDMAKGKAVNDAVISLQEHIILAQKSALDAQSHEAAQLARIGELEKEIAQLKEWDAQLKQYELKEVHVGALAYVPKPNTDEAKTPHWLCVDCADHGRKSILQDVGRTKNNRESRYQCPSCKSAILVHWSLSPSELAKSERPKDIKLSGVECPYCDGGTALLNERPHPTFADAGIKEHELECVECQKTVIREFDPKNGYS